MARRLSRGIRIERQEWRNGRLVAVVRIARWYFWWLFIRAALSELRNVRIRLNFWRR